MKLLKVILFLLLVLPGYLSGQNAKEYLEGKVFEVTDEGKTVPLFAVNVYWLGTTIGVVTDENGEFRIEWINLTHKLVVSYIGYQNDTIEIGVKDYLTVALKAIINLDKVEIIEKKKSTEISNINPSKVENIGEKELQKAACCNLSESFETNPSVDVSFTDAVTDTRQIQMLGLAGPYTQITREKMVDVRGLSAIYGLSFIPGTWVEGIQLVKGPGSVVNGYESIAGQINVELRKPEDADRLYLNGFGNEGGRREANANLVHRFKNKKLSTALLLHGRNNTTKWDRNGDNFIDKPLSSEFIGLNRWKYIGAKGLRAKIGVKGTYIDNEGGQMGFEPNINNTNQGIWGMQMNMQRIEGWAKIGRVFEDMPWKTVGL